MPRDTALPVRQPTEEAPAAADEEGEKEKEQQEDAYFWGPGTPYIPQIYSPYI